MVDYETVPLLKNGERIRWPRVAGACYEKAAKASENVGAWGVAASDVSTVSFSNVSRRGTVDVLLTEADQTLCAGANKGVHRFLQKYSLVRVGPPDVRLRNRRGELLKDDEDRIMSHDLVVQEIGVPGLWSTEVKCVNRTRYSGLSKARIMARKRAMTLWNRIGDADRPDM